MRGKATHVTQVMPLYSQIVARKGGSFNHPKARFLNTLGGKKPTGKGVPAAAAKRVPCFRYGLKIQGTYRLALMTPLINDAMFESGEGVMLTRCNAVSPCKRTSRLPSGPVCQTSLVNPAVDVPKPSNTGLPSTKIRRIPWLPLVVQKRWLPIR